MDFLNLTISDPIVLEWYNEHRKQLFGHIRLRADNDIDAHDIFQSVWEKVLKKKSIYDPKKADVITFLKNALAENLINDFYRKKSRSGIAISQFLKGEGGETHDEFLAQLLGPDDSNVGNEIEDAQIITLLLKALLMGDHPPHQIFSFGFCKLLEWKPRAIVEELADVQFKDLAIKMEEEYRNHSSLSKAQVESYFKPLHNRMGEKFRDIVSDPKTRASYPHLVDELVGQTKFADYFTNTPEADISHWWDSVKRRLVKFMDRENYL